MPAKTFTAMTYKINLHDINYLSTLTHMNCESWHSHKIANQSHAPMPPRSSPKYIKNEEDEVGIVDEATPAKAAISSTFKDSLQRFQYVAEPTQSSTTRALRSSTKATASSILETNSLAAISPAITQGTIPSSTRRKRPLQPTTTNSPSPSPKKRKRESSKYAPPSKYAHLTPLNDVLAPNLICIFVGTNPGIRTATSGHAYAHPSNLFWKLLHSSGCTDRRCRPEEDVDLPRLYAMGNTNIVERPTKDAAELSKVEMSAGTERLEAKFREFRPEAVCIVGKGIWEAIWRFKHGRNLRKEEFRWGWQDDAENMGIEGGWAGSRVFVASSTSGLSASLKPPEKEAIWKPFGEWVQQRRKERATVKDEDEDEDKD